MARIETNTVASWPQRRRRVRLESQENLSSSIGRPAQLLGEKARDLLRSGSIGYAAGIATVAAAYYATAKLGLSLAHENRSITAVWAPTGISLAALVLGGCRLWPGVALGAFLANSWTGLPALAVAGITIGNTLEALAGLYLLRTVRFRPALERVRDVLALVLLAGVLSTAVSATVGVASLRLAGAVEPSGLGSAWRVWWLGDMGGDLLVAPLLLVLAATLRSPPPRGRLAEAAVLLAALAAVAALVLAQAAPIAYVIFPLLVWTALRLGQLGAVVGSTLLAGIAISLTDHGFGPFVRDTPDTSLLLAQSFVALGAATALLFAATASERRRAVAELKRGRNELAAGVRRRTLELERSFQELELQSAVVANMRDGVVLIRASDGTVVYANPTFEHMFGYGPGELDARPLALVHVPRGRSDDGTAAGIVAALDADGSWSGELESVRKDGTPFWCRVNISTFAHPEHGTVWISVHTDITERREAERARAHVEEELRQAQKMEAIGRLAGGVAHDFNNMLTAILSYSDLLLAGLSELDPRYRYTLEIEQAGRRAQRLTQQLLSFGRRQRLEPATVDLNELVEGMSGLLRPLLGDDIVLETWLSPGLALVEVDRIQFEQVILNLAANARDAMPAGGRLTIETANVADDAWSYLDLERGSYVMLAVRDSGGGMDEETVARAFEPFFTTKEVGKGTGLGLSSIQGIVEQSGGRVAIASELGKGTSVAIYLPSTELTAAAAADPLRERRVIRSGSETVLVVEDDDAVRLLATLVLREAGYTVLEASSGPAAIELAHAYDAPIDLLVTDVTMPVMRGDELAEQLTSERPELALLYVSGYTGDDLVARGLLEPGVHLLAKPFVGHELLEQVRTILDDPRSPTKASSRGDRQRSATT